MGCPDHLNYMNHGKSFLPLNVTWTHAKALLGSEALGVRVLHQKGNKILTKKEKGREFQSRVVKCSGLSWEILSALD